MSPSNPLENAVLPESGNLPLVSVVCLTYNQEKFVARAIEGFVSQEVNFSFEILIHDDASPDGTLAIVREFEAKYPDLIRVIAQQENQYSKGVRMPALVFAQARGKYIAYCEGDDYWTDSRKLQKQVDLLNRHSEVGAVFTDADILYDDSKKLVKSADRVVGHRSPTGDVRSALLQDNPYKTCTSLFRAELVRGYEATANQLRARMDDYVMWLTIAEKSSFAYLDESTATYRVLRQSASHFLNPAPAIKFARSRARIALCFNQRFGHPIEERIIWQNYRRSVIHNCLAHRRYRAAFRRSGSVSRFVVHCLRYLAKATASRLSDYRAGIRRD